MTIPQIWKGKQEWGLWTLWYPYGCWWLQWLLACWIFEVQEPQKPMGMTGMMTGWQADRGQRNSEEKRQQTRHDMGVSKNSGTPKWIVIKENPIKIDLGVPLFLETSTFLAILCDLCFWLFEWPTSKVLLVPKQLVDSKGLHLNHLLCS